MNPVITAEQQVIGALLTFPESLNHAEGLKPKHFAESLHVGLMAEILAVSAEGGNPTLPILSARLRLSADENRYFARCIAAAGSVIGMRELVDCVIAESQRREVSALCRETAQLLEEGGDVATLIAELRGKIDGSIEHRRMRHSGKVTEAIIADLTANVTPVSTGIARLDKAMAGGLIPGKAYGFAARKKVGKTILASTVSHNLNHAGVKHLFLCAEMGEREIHQRNLARELGMYPSGWRDGYAKAPHNLNRLGEIAVSGPRNTIYLDAPGISFAELRRAVATAVMRHKISGFVLDYWQLVGGKEPRMSTAEHLGDVAQWIADICRKMRIWAFVTAQINQEGNTRGGEGIRLAFDQVYQIHAQDGDTTTPGDLSLPGRWLEMMDTRYTAWLNVGSLHEPALMLNEKGPFFEECADQPALYSAA